MPFINKNEEAEAIREYKFKHSHEGLTDEQVLRRVEFYIRDFTHPTFKGTQTMYPLWAVRLLEALSDGCYIYNPKGIFSFEDLKEHFLNHVEEATQDDREWYEDDPKGWKDTNPRRELGTHPWGDDIVKRCQNFLSLATPWKVSTIYDYITHIGMEKLHEDMLNMATGSNDRSSIQIAVERAFEDVVKNLITSLESETPSFPAAT